MKKLDLDFGELSARPYKSDIIERHTPTYLRFTTPAGKQGEGTNSRLMAGNLPIEGIRKIVGTAREPDLLSIDVRLPAHLTSLAQIILADPT